jgi:type IX secretion system PorP/SprF family membrane protein
VNLNYRRNFFSDQVSVSVNNYYDKFKSGLGFIVYNDRQAKGSLNNFSFGAIYSYKVFLNERSFINTALQAGYHQQTVNSGKLIFSDQIDPMSGIVNNASGEISFLPYNNYDFSFGTVFITNKIRAGVSAIHIDKLFRNDDQIKAGFNFHFGKVFSVFEFSDDRDYYLIPEVIYKISGSVHQLIYSVHLNSENFISRIYVKHNLGLNLFSTAIAVGYDYRNIRISYTYEINLTKYLAVPVSSNQLTLKYRMFCKEKRNNKNTIYCSNF